MRTRNVFKKTDFKCLIYKEHEGPEIEFPDVPDDGTPQKGDKVLTDGTEAESGACTLPDGTAVYWENGKVTEVNADPQPEDSINLKSVRAVKHGPCRAFSAWKNNKRQNLEILGDNEKTPFRKGNRALVDGKAMMLAKVEIDGKEVKIQNGRIASVKSLNAKTPGTRNVIKLASGKKVIATKKVEKPAGKKVVAKPVEPKTDAKKGKNVLNGGEKMTYMKKMK